MGNICPTEDTAQLASVARDICPFPHYTPSPHFINMLSVNSSVNLRKHYAAVQASLTPKQLDDFTEGLRAAVGREGKVTLGGVGVVALSLAVLFDTLARQAKGEWVSDSGPIPGLFVKDVRGYYPPHVHTVSEYLRLVPHIANNPSRMREETERYIKRFKLDDRSLEESQTLLVKEHITALNVRLGQFFADSLELHLLRINNGTADDLVRSHRKPPYDVVFNLNCDPQTGDEKFFAAVQKSDNATQEAFKRFLTEPRPKTWLQQVAELELLNVIFGISCAITNTVDARIAQREDFDLKDDALGKWAE